MSETAEDRAARRREQARAWPVRRYALGQEPALDPDDTSSAEQRVAMMWPLAVQMWTLAGIELPQYDRERAPGRLIRPAEDCK